MNVSNFSLKTQMNENENALSENMLSQFLRSYDNNTVQRQGSLGRWGLVRFAGLATA